MMAAGMKCHWIPNYLRANTTVSLNPIQRPVHLTTRTGTVAVSEKLRCVLTDSPTDSKTLPMNALILVDLQNDFTPSGALPVPEGDSIVPLINHLQQKFDLVVATQDWHPPDHQSFAVQHEGRQPGELIDLHGIPQVLWPIHCVQETEGAQFISNLDQSRVERVFRKGQNPRIDSYSGFFDNDHQSSTGMGEYLREQGVDEVFVVGLATDYCVRFTAADAAEL